MPTRPLFSELTTMGVGGPAEYFVDVPDVPALRDALSDARSQGRQVLVLGGGSNLVVSDEGFAGSVVRIGIKGCRRDNDGELVRVEVGAGEDWASFVAQCISEGLSGVECLSGIPGTAGATPVQNVGAYGQEVGQVAREVTVWDASGGSLRVMQAEECGFGYRTSVFKRQQLEHGPVVTSVTLCLERSVLSQPLRYAELCRYMGVKLGARPPLRETAEAVLELRRTKGMVLDANDPDTKSAGSFFTNPVLSVDQMAEFERLAPGAPGFKVTGGTKVPAAWLVEHAGFARGFEMGGAAISSKHTLAIAAKPGAPASDVVNLARAVRAGVASRFGVWLEPEPVLVGLDL